MARHRVDDLELPIENRQDLRKAFTLIQGFEADPAALLSWVPEEDIPLIDRERREMALSLYLVFLLETRNGEIESRVRACRQVFTRNLRAPAEAVKTAELLLRSRMLSGGTDIETFWLAAAFAHPLAPIVHPDIQRTAWAYLRHAPFNLDPRAATLFAKAGKTLRRPPFPRWPMELVEWLMRRPEQADLGAAILQAHLCVQLGARTPADLAEKLLAGKRDPDQVTLEALELLARYYVRVEADATHARDIVTFVAQRVVDPSPYRPYLDRMVFDLPYDELYDLVTDHLDDVDHLDALYRRFCDRGRWDVARRLVEAELVKRLDPWYFGGFQPHLTRALSRILAGEDPDPRVRELVVRLVRIHARTSMVNAEARRLLDRISDRPEYLEPGVPVHEIRRGIGAFLQAAEPMNLLERERQLVEARKDMLSLADQGVIDEVYTWVQRRFRPRVEALRPVAALELGSGSDALAALGERRTAIRDVEKHLARFYLKIVTPTFGDRVRKDVARALAVPFDQIRTLDLASVYCLARAQARRGRWPAFGLGAIAGVTSGTGGTVVDLAAVGALAARTVVRIGACFGLDPESNESFEFLVDTLFATLSVDAGGGLVAYLVDQKPVVRHFVWVTLAQYLSARVRSALREERRRGPDGKVAMGLVALSRRLVPGWGAPHWRHAIAVVNAAVAGAANVQLYEAFTQAAVNIAARRWLLERLGLAAPRGPGEAFHTAGTVPPSSVARVW